MEKNPKDNLITVKQIKELLYKYNIGKRPLSLLLDFGEVTITRYLDGQTPNKRYSDKLLDLLNSPTEMKKALELGKNKIARIAYEKCYATTESLLSSSKNVVIPMSKIDNATKYLIYKLSEVTPLALQKLLYYSQGLYSAFFNDYLFDDDCEAWMTGPVYKDVYYRYKCYGYNPMDRSENMDFLYFDDNFTTEEYAVLDSVVKHFGRYSGKILEEMTQTEEPWRSCIKGKREDDSNYDIISKEKIRDYFKQIVQKYDMLNLADISDYSENLLKKII